MRRGPLPCGFSFPPPPRCTRGGGGKEETCSDATANRGYKPRSTRRSRGGKAAEAASKRIRIQAVPRKTATPLASAAGGESRRAGMPAARIFCGAGTGAAGRLNIEWCPSSSRPLTKFGKGDTEKGTGTFSHGKGGHGKGDRHLFPTAGKGASPLFRKPVSTTAGGRSYSCFSPRALR